MMSRAMKSFIISLMLLLVAGAWSEAQEPPTQQVSFFAFHAPSFPAKIYVRSRRGQFEEVLLEGANTTSPVKTVNVRGAIRIYGEAVANEEGELVRPVIGEIAAKRQWEKVFAVVVGEEEEDNTAYQGRAFELNEGRFPDGSIKVVNMTDRPLRGILGKQTVAFAPREMGTVRFKGKKGSQIDVSFLYQRPESQKWVRMVASRWAIPDGGRKLMFIYQDPRTGRMRTKTIPIQEE